MVDSTSLKKMPKLSASLSVMVYNIVKPVGTSCRNNTCFEHQTRPQVAPHEYMTSGLILRQTQRAPRRRLCCWTILQSCSSGKYLVAYMLAWHCIMWRNMWMPGDGHGCRRCTLFPVVVMLSADSLLGLHLSDCHREMYRDYWTQSMQLK